MKEIKSAFEQESKATLEQQRKFDELGELLLNLDATPRDLVTNLGLFIRSSALAKILFIDELYRRVIRIPGNFYEFGSWMGQNLILLENLRALYEPFNPSRRIYGFDTYSGYPENGSVSADVPALQVGGYSVTTKFQRQFDELAAIHESLSVIGNGNRISRVSGDVSETVERHFRSHPSELVALAYFDMAGYDSTLVALSQVLDRCVPGSVIMFDELNHSKYSGETIAFLELMKDRRYKIEKSQFMTDRTIVTLL